MSTGFFYKYICAEQNYFYGSSLIERSPRPFYFKIKQRPAKPTAVLWWRHTDSNRGPLACEASALTS